MSKITIYNSSASSDISGKKIMLNDFKYYDDGNILGYALIFESVQGANQIVSDIKYDGNGKIIGRAITYPALPAQSRTKTEQNIKCNNFGDRIYWEEIKPLNNKIKTALNCQVEPVTISSQIYYRIYGRLTEASGAQNGVPYRIINIGIEGPPFGNPPIQGYTIIEPHTDADGNYSTIHNAVHSGEHKVSAGFVQHDDTYSNSNCVNLTFCTIDETVATKAGPFILEQKAEKSFSDDERPGASWYRFRK